MSNVRTNARTLLSLLRYAPMHVTGGREVMDQLDEMGSAAVPVLAEALEDRREATIVRLAAAWLLARRPVTRALDALRRAMADRDADVAEAARQALDRAGVAALAA